MTTDVILAALISGAAACVTDVHSQRIPNWLTFGSAALAIGVHAVLPSGHGAASGLVGWAVGVALFLPFFLLGGMGGGDVKLLGALGAWLGAPTVLWLAAYSAMAGGVLALVVSLHAGYARTLFRNIGMLLRFWSLTGIRPLPALTLAEGTGPRLAYAVPMFAGTVVTIWLH